ncbi:heterokaryon incompatibility protein-domain-containing protein [Aspergillus sergii]|uniref:Heterokaryon incompatibility protein-domain-containing protein n=1 Tax=Aspergillus sergii TaxID=1034303 RepID=A0A5N6X053_9EURO|nr:heterokaryon incompatibility protein-domain-containing protein [Aspergillus sergii]
MRLLNARTLQLTEFASDFPPYAILSHTWSSEEVSFEEIHSSEARYKLGYQKIQKCCEQALVDNLEYVWVDTCCIDQSSSAELSEAINSMFQWYKSARVCYVHLAVVESPYRKNARTTLLTYAPDGNPSRWYTRGWTLQELLAPSNVVFYNREWRWIGTKRQLLEEVSGITGVDEINLIGLGIKSTCIGQKMSWAASRKTTRIEDKAYCLLGLCGVHMPLLYGEGENAFRRLHEEIIRTSTDMSIFAWGDAIIAGESLPAHPDPSLIFHISPIRPGVPWAIAYIKWYHKYIDYPIPALTAVIKLGEHTVTDRGTYLTLSNTDKDLTDQLEIYKRGDEYEELLNPADIITSKDSDNKELVQDFVQWVLSGDGQDVIVNFHKEDRYCLCNGFPTEDSEDVEASDELS